MNVNFLLLGEARARCIDLCYDTSLVVIFHIHVVSYENITIWEFDEIYLTFFLLFC